MYEYKCALVRVVDGDTVRLIVDLGFYTSRVEQPYRLLRINAPEMGTSEGQYAKSMLEGFLSGKNLVCQTQKSDSFGRFLCELYANGENASDWMIAGGHASYYLPR